MSLSSAVSHLTIKGPSSYLVLLQLPRIPLLEARAALLKLLPAALDLLFVSVLESFIPKFESSPAQEQGVVEHTCMYMFLACRLEAASQKLELLPPIPATL